MWINITPYLARSFHRIDNTIDLIDNQTLYKINSILQISTLFCHPKKCDFHMKMSSFVEVYLENRWINIDCLWLTHGLKNDSRQVMTVGFVLHRGNLFVKLKFTLHSVEIFCLFWTHLSNLHCDTVTLRHDLHNYASIHALRSIQAVFTAVSSYNWRNLGCIITNNKKCNGFSSKLIRDISIKKCLLRACKRSISFF